MLMKTLPLQTLILLLLGLSGTAHAGGPDLPRPWLPITPQDLALKEIPDATGAEAVQMYYADEIDDVEHDEFFYSRVKVLNEAGKQRANVEIAVFPGTSIHDLEARTIHPGGSIVPFSESSFERTIIKGKGFSIRAKTFAFPEVTTGSIIEYKYRLHRDDKSYPDQTWIIQHDLYTLKEHFWFRYDGRGGRRVAWKTTPGFPGGPVEHSGILEMETENIPAFQKEELMPPEENYKLKVKFFYGGSEVSSASSYWYQYGGLLAQYFRYFIGDSKEVKKVTAEVIGNEKDPEQKLRKIYARVQDITNLSYERHKSGQEQKKEHLKKNASIEDVLKHGYGETGDITALFVGMAQTAGIDASVVLASSRTTKIFDKGVLSLNQLDSIIARVNLPGDTKYKYLDPGTRFCPYGTVRWPHTATTGMDMKRPGDLIQVPGFSYDTAITGRAGTFNLQPDGELKGTVILSFTGIEALEHRLATLETDEAGRNKDLEQELKDRLPKDSVVKLTDSQGWATATAPLSATFSVTIPAFASAAGTRLLLPAVLLDTGKKTRLQATTRKYPIYFNYAYAETDKLIITLPDGYSLENVPEAVEAKLPWAKYARAVKMNGKELVMERLLQFNGIMFDPATYPELKTFFNKINAGDESQSVLRQSPAEAQKSAN
jgi:hypothetical protein